MKFNFGWLFSIVCGFKYPPLLPKSVTDPRPSMCVNFQIGQVGHKVDFVKNYQFHIYFVY